MTDVGVYMRRALRTWTLYGGRRDSVRGTLAALREHLGHASDGDRVVLRFTPGTIVAREDAEDDGDESADAVVYVAFRDGVRALALEPTIPEHELATLVGILASGNERQRNQAEDVVAQLWAANLPHVQVAAVDPYADIEIVVTEPGAGPGADSLLPNVRGSASGDGDALGARGQLFGGASGEGNAADAGAGGVESRGTVGGEAAPRTMSDIVAEQVRSWRAAADPALLALPSGARVERHPRRRGSVDWGGLQEAREGARVSLAIERIVACHGGAVGPVDALMQVTLGAWQASDGEALDTLVGALVTLPAPTLDRWRATLGMNVTYATAVQEGLAAQAIAVPDAVAQWFRVAGDMHAESVARGLFSERAREVVATWLRVAPECAPFSLQHWLSADAGDAVWAARCAATLPPGEARSTVLRRALGHKDGDVQFAALQGLTGDTAGETNAALGRALASGRRERVQYVLREVAARGDKDALALLLEYADTNELAEAPAIQRAAVLDVLLAKPTVEVIAWVRERTSGWGWRLSARGRERNADIAAALQRLPPAVRTAYT